MGVERRSRVRALAVPLLASAAIVVGSPYIGQVRAALQAAFPGHYRSLVAGLVLVALGVALGAALSRIRERRATRYACLVAALALGAAYARVIRTGNVDQDLVEQFHFVEYGLLTLLFCRAWRYRPDLSAVALPACAAFTVGVADEWVQWFVPTRVGEFHDVLINGVAVACGLLFSVGVDPPGSLARWPTPPASRLVAAGLTASCVATGLFVHSVHLGHVVSVPDAGRFRSTFSRAELEAAAADRARRWREHPPVVAAGIAREDHYLSEGQWHVQRRNEAHDEGDGWTAWNENLILERFFAPVLELGARWSPDDRAALSAAAAPSPAYDSDAEPYPILAVGAWRLWVVVAVVVSGIWAVAMRPGRRLARPVHV